MLPIAPQHHMQALENFDPVVHLLYLLLISVGVPYFLLSTTSPLLQSWYARAYNAVPYRLFALSNLASLIGLLAYPILIEPRLSLSQQSGYWSGAYIAFALACILTALHGAKEIGVKDSQAMEEISSLTEATPPVTSEKILWTALAACASALLLSTTNYLTQDIASIPFLWILPLCLYLLTFILCFEREDCYSRKWYVWIMAVVLGTMSYILVGPSKFDMVSKITLFSIGLFVCCMFCHGELAARKPRAGHLTSFYLRISLGGAIGGVLVGIIAPKTLPGPFEFVLAMSACALLLFKVNFRKGVANTVVCGILAVSLLIASGSYIYSFGEGSLLLTRNFYGCLKVNEYEKGTEDEHRTLVHGIITHGVQFMEPDRRLEPVSYYSPESGVGLAGMLSKRSAARGIIGLGIGSLLGYARQNDYYHFYEINPLVREVALKDFSFLNGCRGQVEVSIGDGRLLLERENDQHYDLLVVDAFSSDSIPVHLLYCRSDGDLFPPSQIGRYPSLAHIEFIPSPSPRCGTGLHKAGQESCSYHQCER